MSIYGIEGGIGTGKTLTLVYMMYEDALKGKKLLTNVNIKNFPKNLAKNVTFLTADVIIDMFYRIKEGEINLLNTTIGIQEMHNYIDSRTSASKKNRIFTYFILQSRHTGQGTCDIIYDTQNFGQVDLRLRRNTDYFIHPQIITKVGHKPDKIFLEMAGKIGHSWQEYERIIEVGKVLEYYDTHELVDF